MFDFRDSFFFKILAPNWLAKRSLALFLKSDGLVIVVLLSPLPIPDRIVFYYKKNLLGESREFFVVFGTPLPRGLLLLLVLKSKRVDPILFLLRLSKLHDALTSSFLSILYPPTLFL